jgi:hypothetical protein
MFFAGKRLASSRVRMSSHMLSEPCGELLAGCHSDRTSSGALGSRTVPAGSAAGAILHRSFHC